jgi:hypothetical protein
MRKARLAGLAPPLSKDRLNNIKDPLDYLDKYVLIK